MRQQPHQRRVSAGAIAGSTKLASLPTAEARMDPLYGLTLRRKFGHHFFYGHVARVDHNVLTGERFYHVVYEDGDSEHLNSTEVRAYLITPKSDPLAPAACRPAEPGRADCTDELMQPFPWQQLVVILVLLVMAVLGSLWPSSEPSLQQPSQAENLDTPERSASLLGAALSDPADASQRWSDHSAVQEPSPEAVWWGASKADDSALRLPTDDVASGAVAASHASAPGDEAQTHWLHAWPGERVRDSNEVLTREEDNFDAKVGAIRLAAPGFEAQEAPPLEEDAWPTPRRGRDSNEDLTPEEKIFSAEVPSDAFYEFELRHRELLVGTAHGSDEGFVAELETRGEFYFVAVVLLVVLAGLFCALQSLSVSATPSPLLFPGDAKLHLGVAAGTAGAPAPTTPLQHVQPHRHSPSPGQSWELAGQSPWTPVTSLSAEAWERAGQSPASVERHVATPLRSMLSCSPAPQCQPPVSWNEADLQQLHVGRFYLIKLGERDAVARLDSPVQPDGSVSMSAYYAQRWRSGRITFQKVDDKGIRLNAMELNPWTVFDLVQGEAPPNVAERFWQAAPVM